MCEWDRGPEAEGRTRGGHGAAEATGLMWTSTRGLVG